MCTTWLIPFPGLLNQNPKRAAADCKKMIIHIFYNPFGASYDRYIEFPVWLFFSSKASSMTSVPVAS
jgi:hypothetical protein